MNFLQSLNRVFARTPRPISSAPIGGSDSHPASFSAVPIMSDERAKNLTESDMTHFLTPALLRRCWEDQLRGDWAEQQWLWEQLEKLDARLLACCRNRDAALAEYQPVIEIADDLSDAEQALAESQKSTMDDLLTSIINLTEAITELGVASRRHYTLLQPVDDGNHLRLNSVPRWLLCRDGYSGLWRYNPNAQSGAQGMNFPTPWEHMIFRCCPTPLNLAAQMLVLNRKSTLSQWDVMLATYGSPPLFLVMPEGISSQDKDKYLKSAVQCVSNAKGVLPNGSDIKTAAMPATSADLFAARIAQSNDDITLLYRGSMLTQDTASGSGTLAGGAHADTTDRLAAMEARDIESLLHRSLLLPMMAQYHPAQPVLIKFAMRRDESLSVAEELVSLAQLRAAGYSANIEQASSRTGWDLSEAPIMPSAGAPAAGMNSASELRRAYHCNRSGIIHPAARAQYSRSMHKRIAAAEAREKKDDKPSAEELHMWQQLLAQNKWSSARVEADSKKAQAALEGALMTPPSKAAQKS